MTPRSPFRGRRSLAPCAVVALASALWIVPAPYAAQEPTEPPRQVVTERSPVRTATTFAYRFPRRLANLDWSGGRVVVAVRQLPADKHEYGQLESLQPGQVLELHRSPVIRLQTSAPLRFEDATLPTGNVADDYDGVYGLWLRRQADGEGWELVANDEADAWGTQRDPSHDRAVVALSHRDLPGLAGALEVELQGAAEDAVLRLSWGELELTARFQVVAEAPDASDSGESRD